jgi:cystathionine beta-lyase
MPERKYDREYFDQLHERKNTGSLKYSTPPKGNIDEVLSMWVADMDFKAPYCVEEAIKGLAELGIYGYESEEDGFEEAVCSWLRKCRGWELKAENVLRSPGVVYAFTNVIKALTEEGDAVLINQPVYYPFEYFIKNSGRKAVVSELVRKDDKYYMDFDDMEKKIVENDVRAFLFCSPHNPVARVWTKEELRQAAELCLKYDVTIISDEIHSDLIFPGNVHTPMAMLSDEIAEKTVTLVAPSKTFNLAGLQASAIIHKDPEVLKKIDEAIISTGTGGLNNAGARAAIAVYTSEDAVNWLEGLIPYLEENYRLLAEAFPPDGSAKIRTLPMEGTYLTWLDCRDLGLDKDGLEELFLEKAKIWLDNGAMFGKGGEGYMRVNIACPSSIVKEAVRRLKEIID